MIREPYEVPIERLIVEHYLFDLDQPVEKTAEILGEDEERVRKIHDDYVKIIGVTWKGNK